MTQSRPAAGATNREERYGSLLAMYRSLSAGEGFVLIDRHDPLPYLNILQRLHPGEFDWFPLSIQPEEWRVGLSRRPARPSGPQRVSQPGGVLRQPRGQRRAPAVQLG